MYKAKYQYDERYFPGFTTFLNKLHDRSFRQYLSQYATINSDKEKRTDLIQINNFINYLEDYVVTLTKLGFLNTANISDVISEIKKIKTISVLPKNQRGIYGLTTYDYRIEINPNLGPSKTLTSEERTLLYVGHEIGHIIHKMWTKDVEEYLKYVGFNSNLQPIVERTSSNNRLCALDGFSLIDEATTQEIAEIVAYHQNNKQRPNKQYYATPKIYNGEAFKSNFDYYKELEEPAILFARTLRGISPSKNTPDSEIMSSLAKRSFDKNFVWDIVKEYQETPQLEQDFYNTLICLGRIKDASYGVFGMANLPDSTPLSQKYFQNLKYFCSKNKDYRPKTKKI